LDVDMEYFETVTNNTGSVVAGDGNGDGEVMSDRDAESIIEDDSNMTDRY
jgi:hypothetical protein